MQLKTILNRVERYKSFVYGEPRWADDARATIEVPIEPRANGRPICSGCGKRRPGYDRLKPRRYFETPSTAQPWPTWIERGYVDLVDISGYCYPANYVERYLDVFTQRMREAVALRDATGRSTLITFVLGIKTSHGEIDSVAEMEKYLAKAKLARVEGVSLFNWGAAQPYLEELRQSPVFDSMGEPSK